MLTLQLAELPYIIAGFQQAVLFQVSSAGCATYALVLGTWDLSSWSSQLLLFQPGGRPPLDYHAYSCDKIQTATTTATEKQYVWVLFEDLCLSWRPCNNDTK